VGKRSDFERIERDFYPTPEAAVQPLLPHFYGDETFVEPCAGDGALIRHLEKAGLLCAAAYDLVPKKTTVLPGNALDLTARDCGEADYIITNPPWGREVLHPMIENFRSIAPTWLLFDADWMHTKQASPYLIYCAKIVSVGRVKWFPETNMVGKDNCAWYLFLDEPTETVFYGR
jgi:hypothetical protein